MRKHDKKTKDLFAFFLSLFIHALIFFFLCVGVVHFSKNATSPKKDILPPPEVIFDLSPPATQTPSTLRTDSEHPLDQPPEHTAFESHENTVAASELPATGSAPLPTQEGRTTDDVELKTSEIEGRLIPAATALPPREIEPLKPTPISTPAPTPFATPLPTPPLTALPSTTTPVLAAATPINKPSVATPVMGTLSSAAKTESEESGAHPSMIHGTISNKGKSSVSAEATPLGRYKKNLADAISSHWYYSIDQRMELLSYGTATVIFYVTQTGRAEELRIISNSSNQTFADCCVESIMGAKLPAIPLEIAKTLDRGRLEIEYRFTIYP